jgi:hypothetical protein
MMPLGMCATSVARCNPLTTVITDVWEKDKRARDATEEEEERNIRQAKRASIRSKMVLRLRGRRLVE